MTRQQHTLMRFDPATGIEQPYPSHAEQWREWHGRCTAWLCNPWTGERRDARDVGSDPFGQLIVPPGEPVYAEAAPRLTREQAQHAAREAFNVFKDSCSHTKEAIAYMESLLLVALDKPATTGATA